MSKNKPSYIGQIVTSQNVTNREFGKVRFEDTIFVNCNFKDVEFISCFFDNVHFSGCNFDGVDARNSAFKSCSFKRGTYGKGRQVRFSACTFVTSTFDQLAADKLVFDNRSSIVDGSFLGGSFCLKLKDCVISESAFGNTSLPKLEADGCKFIGVSFRHTDLRQAKITRSTLTETCFHRALTDRMTMLSGSMSGTIWSYSTLSDSVFTGVEFKETSILESVCNTVLFDKCSGTAFLRVGGSYLARSRFAKCDIPIAFIPPEGELKAWTKVNGVFLELLIPRNSRRLRSPSGRIYVDAVKTINVHGMLETVKEILPKPGETRIFEEGKITTIDEFKDDYFNAAPKGIPVYLTRLEAQRGYE